MSRVFAAAGALARTPYYMEKLDRNIYSVEELSYSLMQSARYLDESIMDPALVEWLETECNVPELTKELSAYLGQDRLLTDFVTAILRFTGYATREQEEETRQVVEIGGALEPLQKSISEADYLADNRHTYQAIAAYDAVLRAHPNLEKKMRAVLERKKGVLYTRVFRFVQASDSFLRAYELTGDPESYLYYLAAVRLSLSDDEYVSFIAEHPEAYEYSMTLEERMREAERAYRSEGGESRIGKLSGYYEKGQMTGFELELTHLVKDLKNDYRRQNSI